MSYRNRLCGLCATIFFVTTAGCVSPYAYYGDAACGGAASFSGRYSDEACGECLDCGTSASITCSSHTLTGTLQQSATCGGGCGKMYWGEWTYDPPDKCDPCDDHGSWIGTRCCPPRFLTLLGFGLRGQRCDAQSSCGSCGECVQEETAFFDSELGYYEGQVYEDETLYDMGGEITYDVDGEAMQPTSDRQLVPSVRQPASNPGPAEANSRSDSAHNPNSRLIRRPRR